MSSRIDLHIHTNASDGTYSPEELLAKVREAGIETFAVTDHDTIKGAMAMKKLISGEPVKFVAGIEFSCRMKTGKAHILGFNYDETSEAFIKVLRAGDDLRHAKFFKRIEFLHDKFNINFTDDEIQNLLKIPSVGKPHLGNLIVAKGRASTRAQAIESFIDKCKTGNDKIDAEFAISSIISSGGVAVWAHPLGGEREPELPVDKFRASLDELTSYGLQGLECYYSKYEVSKCEWLADVARKRELYVSGGSDCHGTNKSIPLGRLNTEDRFISHELLSILRSGIV